MAKPRDRRTARRPLLSLAAGGWLFSVQVSVQVDADADSHLWRVNEVFSSTDGKVQFIELHECCGATQEILLENLEVTSKATGSVFTFPADLSGLTDRKFLLLGTAAYAALCDANDDGSIDVSDGVAVLAMLFQGAELAAPADCGEDATLDGIGCAAFSGCM